MTRIITGRSRAGETAAAGGETNTWKKTVARTFVGLELIPERFNGELVVTFKDGGVSYLRRTETFK